MPRITGYSAARPSGVCCLESLSDAQRAGLGGSDALQVEQHRGGDERSGEAAAAGLVGAGDEPDAEPAVEVQQAPAGARPARLAGATRRRRDQSVPIRSGGQ